MSTTSQKKKNLEEKNLRCWDILISDLKITHDFFQHQIIYQTDRCSLWKEDIYIQRYIISMTVFILLSLLGASVESGRKVWVVLLNWATLITIGESDSLSFCPSSYILSSFKVRDCPGFEFCFCHLLAKWLWGQLLNLSQAVCWMRDFFNNNNYKAYCKN